METKLLDWLGKTGYPLELWTEVQFSKKGFLAFASHPYEDHESHDHRELDVVASKYWSSASPYIEFEITLLIECKKSDKPFVILRSTRKRTGRDSAVSAGDYYFMSDPMVHLLISNSKTDIPLPGKSSRGFKLVQGFTTSDEVPHKAAFTLFKAYKDWRDSEKKYLKDNIRENHNSIAIPLLVLDAPLFELSTEANGALNLRRIESGIVDQMAMWPDIPHEAFAIPIVHKDSLNEFIQSTIRFGREQLNYLKKNPNAQIKNFKKVELRIAPISKKGKEKGLVLDKKKRRSKKKNK